MNAAGSLQPSFLRGQGDDDVLEITQFDPSTGQGFQFRHQVRSVRARCFAVDWREIHWRWLACIDLV